MVKPAKGPDPEKITEKTGKDAEVETLQAATGDPEVGKEELGDKKPSPLSGHSDDPDFYVDQHGLVRWRVLGGGGEVITSADQGFESEAEAKKDFEDAKKTGRLINLMEFQGKSASGFTTTENIHQDDDQKK